MKSLNPQPIYFNVFDAINQKVNNIEATALFSKLQYHCKHSVISRSGQIWFTRTRAEIAKWFALSPAKVSTLLKELENAGLLVYQNFKYRSAKQLHISVPNHHASYVNFQLLEQAVTLCGSLQTALLFLKLHFHFQHSIIEMDHLKWTTRSREHLANWAGISLRTLDSRLNHLEAKGLIMKRVYQWQGAPQLHFHIPDCVTTLFTNAPMTPTMTSLPQEKEAIEPNNSHNFCRIDPAKNETPYIREIKQLKKTNNTYQDSKSVTHNPILGDMSFKNNAFANIQSSENQQETILTAQQQRYLEGALRQLLTRDKCKVSNPKELIEQLKFSITSWVSTKQLSFTHAVNRAFAIIRSGNWRTPLGFSVYSDVGQQYHQAILAREQLEQSKMKREFTEGQGELSTEAKSLAQRLLQAKKEEITAKALTIATQLVKIEQRPSKEKSSLSELSINLWSRLQELLVAGADRAIITQHCHALGNQG